MKAESTQETLNDDDILKTKNWQRWDLVGKWN